MKKLIFLFFLLWSAFASAQVIGVPGGTTKIQGDVNVTGNYYQNGSLFGGGGAGGADRLGQRVYYMSKMGFVSNCDTSKLFPLFYGTDQTALMQRLLDSAKYYPSQNIVIINDGLCISTTGNDIWSNTTILGDYHNAKFVLRPGSSHPIFMNKHPMFGMTFDKDILIQGVNFNVSGFDSGGTRQNQRGGNSYGVMAAVAMYGVDNYKLIDCYGYNSGGYMFEANSCNNSYNIRCYGEQAKYVNPLVYGGFGSDCFHFDGEAHHDWIIDCTAKHCGDDNVAFNASDVYYTGAILPNVANTFYPVTANGNQTDMHVINFHFDSSYRYGFRLFNYYPYYQDGVTVDGLYGVVLSDKWFIEDNYSAALGAGTFRNVTLKNFNVTDLQAQQGTAGDILINCSNQNLTIDNGMFDKVICLAQTTRKPDIVFQSPYGLKLTQVNTTLSNCKWYDSSYNTTTFRYLFDSNVVFYNLLFKDNMAYRSRDTFPTGAKINSNLIYQNHLDTICNFEYSNIINSGTDFTLGLAGYTHNFIASSSISRHNGPAPYGFINLSPSGTYGQIDNLIMNGVAIDSGGTDVYLGAHGTCLNKLGSYYTPSQYLRKTGDTSTGTLTAIGQVKLLGGITVPVNYKLNTTYTTTGTEGITTGDATTGNTTTITLCSCTGILQTVTNYGSGGLVNVVAGSATYALNPKASVNVEYNNGIFSPISSYGIVNHSTNNLSTPAITFGAGAGTGASLISITGDDKSGVINFTTGTTSAGAAVVFTATFTQGYTAAPRVTITPTNTLAVPYPLLAPSVGQVNGVTAGAFNALCNGSGLPASTNLVYTYTIN